jgi:hypothetical protein
MRVCGKILKRELRKEGKRNAEMTSEYINALLDEDVHSAESDESSIDSASVNCVDANREAVMEEINTEEQKGATTNAVVEEEIAPVSLGNILGLCFFMYILCIVIWDNMKL